MRWQARDIQVQGERFLADQLHQCPAPVLLPLGTVEHPAEVTSEQQELLQQKLPRFTTERVRGAGQCIQEEQPAVVLAAVAAAG